MAPGSIVGNVAAMENCQIAGMKSAALIQNPAATIASKDAIFAKGMVVGMPKTEDAKELYDILRDVKECCLFAEDDGVIGVTEDPHIPIELFDRICIALNKRSGSGGGDVE